MQLLELVRAEATQGGVADGIQRDRVLVVRLPVRCEYFFDVFHIRCFC